ncbi:cellulose binding domain-containing protein [Amycolatopsis sp. NPDC059657]|uniref:GH12 family glycosyl hydrolase domain-containing protein n=1 Tax=Amycolatopsis sp. NPDC059657 TaxID=3346899 RepID=UPI00366B466B
MKLRYALSAAGLALAGVTAPVVVAAPAAHADTQICEQFGSTTVGGKYIVMNNRWGTNAQQCINATGNGFQIQTQQGSSSTNGAPVSYPAIYVGCHYGACSPGTNLPRQLNQIGSMPSSITYSYVGGATYDAAYDIWMDPTAKTTGVNQMELMIWFNRQGSIQPIGSPVGTTNINGRGWEVWQGNNGGNDVVSYVAPSAVTSMSFNVMDFVRDVDARTRVDGSWYLTSVQAGFEPWNGGAGLAVNSFSADVNAGSNPGPGPGPSGACAVNYHVDNAWNGGFTATATVKNTGSGTLNDWTLGWNMPSGTQITSGWNATVSQSGQHVTAKAPSWASNLAPGASVAIGFQATGNSTSTPSGFALGQTACTT